MFLLDSIIGAITGKSADGETNPIQAALGGLLTRSMGGESQQA